MTPTQQDTEPSSDSLREEVEAIARPGGLPVGSAGLLQAMDYLLGRVTLLGLVPYRDDRLDLRFEIPELSFINLIGVIQGTDPKSDPMLIGG